SRDEEKLYELILKRFAAHFFPAAEYNVHTLTTKVENESFKSMIKEEVQMGWKTVYVQDDKNKKTDEDEELKIDFHINTDQPVKCNKANTLEKVTTPPKWFTEGTLVAAMQTAGKEIEDEE